MVYEDKRDWVEYNNQLVRRRSFYISIPCIDEWDSELNNLNRDKRGRPFKYPDSLIWFAALAYSFLHLPYRQLEGFIMKLGEFIPGLRSADYTTLWRRISKLHLNLPLQDKEIVVAVDSTGFKVTNRGDWIREKHNTSHRGWIKVHIAVDVDSKRLVAIEVTDERTSDLKVLEPLLENIPLIDGVMDAAYDTEAAFSFFRRKGVAIPSIKLRKNPRAKRNPNRAYAVLEFKELGYELWQKVHQYGRRWAVEGYFSAVKRHFGESVRATSIKNAIEEVKRLFILYDLAKSA